MWSHKLSVSHAQIVFVEWDLCSYALTVMNHVSTVERQAPDSTNADD